jgi:iturin family lipopeptide synthetase B
MKKIEKKNIEGVFGLTPLQEGMWFHYLENTQSENYFEQLSLEISGEIDTVRFRNAWNAVIKTNEMLRSVLRWEKLEKPTQIILKEYTCKITIFDLSSEDSDRMKVLLEGMKEKDRHQPFDLQMVPFRVMLCKLTASHYEMIISNHHIIYDGWSNGIILKEFFRVYHELGQGKKPILLVKPSFKEFVKWIQNLDRRKQEDFWRDYLIGYDTKPELPIKKRKTGKAGKSQSHSLVLE